MDMGYTKEFVAALEFVWGEGYLSPGGEDEVRALIGTHDLKGARILDFGSGLGGIDLLLVEAYGAAEVIGIDVQPEVVALAQELAEKKGLAPRVSFQLVSPGPLPFVDASFDIAFSKDAMVHVADKQSLYAEFMRVLKRGGHLIASDWLWMEGAADNALVQAWNNGNPLGFIYTTVAEARGALAAVGFADIEMLERHVEIAAFNKREITRLQGPARAQLVALVGEDMAEDRLRSARKRQPVLDSGALLPTHIHGRKPAP